MNIFTDNSENRINCIRGNPAEKEKAMENAEKIISLTSKYSQYLDHPNDKDELNKMAESLIELERILHKELIIQKESKFVRFRNSLSRLIKRKTKQ